MNRMLGILMEEEEQDSEAAGGVNGAIGPCMEYMLQHRILDTMYTFARTDVCLFCCLKRFSSYFIKYFYNTFICYCLSL